MRSFHQGTFNHGQHKAPHSKSPDITALTDGLGFKSLNESPVHFKASAYSLRLSFMLIIIFSMLYMSHGVIGTYVCKETKYQRTLTGIKLSLLLNF